MDDYQKYLNKAIFFLKFRPRSEKEIRDYLLKKPFRRQPSTETKTLSPAMIERILSWLKDQKFVDDAEFTRWWIEQRTKFKPKGLRLIKMELKQKGVADEVIAHVLENQESTQGGQMSVCANQEDLAKEIVRKKIDRYKGLPKQEVYQKLGALLGRRGFEWETIKKAIDESFESDILQEK